MESIYSIHSEKEIPDNRLFSQAEGGLFALLRETPSAGSLTTFLVHSSWKTKTINKLELQCKVFVFHAGEVASFSEASF